MELGVPISTGVSLLVGLVCGLGQEVYIYIYTNPYMHIYVYTNFCIIYQYLY